MPMTYGTFVAVGIAAGATIGSLFDMLPIGVGVGLSLGLGVGALYLRGTRPGGRREREGG